MPPTSLNRSLHVWQRSLALLQFFAGQTRSVVSSGEVHKSSKLSSSLMHELQSNLLWLGHALDAREPSPLFDVGITTVVDLAFEELPAQLPRKLIYLRFPLNDGGGNDPFVLRLAVQSLVNLLSTNTRTLVACSAGMSRSPTIAAYALACHLDVTPEAALERIAAIKALEIKGQLWTDVANVFSCVQRPTWQLN